MKQYIILCLLLSTAQQSLKAQNVAGFSGSSNYMAVLNKTELAQVDSIIAMAKLPADALLADTHTLWQLLYTRNSGYKCSPPRSYSHTYKFARPGPALILQKILNLSMLAVYPAGTDIELLNISPLSTVHQRWCLSYHGDYCIISSTSWAGWHPQEFFIYKRTSR